MTYGFGLDRRRSWARWSRCGRLLLLREAAQPATWCCRFIPALPMRIRCDMTAPVKVAYVTPDLVERFARYYAANREWGVFNTWLEDGDYKLAPYTEHEIRGAIVSTEERALMVEFARLTPSQRQKLGKRAEAMFRAGLPARRTA